MAKRRILLEFEENPGQYICRMISQKWEWETGFVLIRGTACISKKKESFIARLF